MSHRGGFNRRDQMPESAMGLDAVEVIMDVEKEFDIAITDPEAERLRTVEELHLLIMAKLAPTDPDPTDVWQRLLDIVVMDLGVPRDRIKPGSSWRELGVD